MRKLSLRYKITLWFSVALLIVVSFTYISILSVSNQILQKTIRDNLIETVENNYDEFRYHTSLDSTDTDRDNSHFLEFESGYLEVNDDFLNEVNGVYTALYSSESNLLYGENPVSRATYGTPFKDSQIQSIDSEGVTYYIFDRRLTLKGLNGLWIRGVVSEKQGDMQMSTITRISLILLPAILLISCIGGYFLVKRMLRPIQKISETAKQIGQKNDLKKRIELGYGNDELHQLAGTFNDTFDKLDKSFETQRRFISDASHELRTPMSVISAQCELALEKPMSEEEYERALKVISRQSQKMSKMINDMLDFTRMEAGSEKYPMETIDMTELVSSVCQDMALIREKNIKLDFEAEKGIVFTGNRLLLSRLLINLISNAYRYGNQNGHIWVCLNREAQKIHLSVKDDGIGIAKGEQDKIFQRFYQSDNSHSGEGVGLGLSMAGEIARFHGGEITVSSEINKGSKFTVIL